MREKEKGGNESEEEHNFIMFFNMFHIYFIYILLENYKIVFVHILTTYAAKNL